MLRQAAILIALGLLTGFLVSAAMTGQMTATRSSPRT
jgi:hypothetical protein